MQMHDPAPEDQTPVEVPVDALAPPSLEERLQMYVRQQMSRYAEAQDLGTFEEEDDFELDNDMDPDPDISTPYDVIELLEDHAEQVPFTPEQQEALQALSEALPKADDPPGEPVEAETKAEQ